MTKLEQCAMAVEEAGQKWLDAQPTQRGWYNVPREIIALAVIEALYEPDEEMIEAGEAAINENISGAPGHESESKSAWQAMLNTIRREG